MAFSLPEDFCNKERKRENKSHENPNCLHPHSLVPALSWFHLIQTHSVPTAGHKYSDTMSLSRCHLSSFSFLSQLAELRQECDARGLETKGNKGELIARLQAYLDEHGEAQ